MSVYIYEYYWKYSFRYSIGVTFVNELLWGGDFHWESNNYEMHARIVFNHCKKKSFIKHMINCLFNWCYKSPRLLFLSFPISLHSFLSFLFSLHVFYFLTVFAFHSQLLRRSNWTLVGQNVSSTDAIKWVLCGYVESRRPTV